MSEIDALIAGAVGGSIAGLGIVFVCLAHIKHVYDQKMMTLRIQMIGLQAMMGVNGDD